MATEVEPINNPTPEGEGPKRALVVAAHPDDSEFGVGGTAALWSSNGWEFYYLICTDGSKGSEDPEMTPEKLVPMRREEQRRAARVLGVKEVFFLGYVDGELDYTRALMKDVVRYIRTLKPYAVFTHDTVQISRNLFVNHPDHRHAGEVAIDAVYPMARNRPTFPELLDEGLEPYSVKELYLWSAAETNFDVDITETMDAKFEALRQHESQFENFDEMAGRVREFWRNEKGGYSERFRRIQLLF